MAQSIEWLVRGRWGDGGDGWRDGGLKELKKEKEQGEGRGGRSVS